MLRLAWVSPFPPERSGIADYSVDLVEALDGLAEVTLFANDVNTFQAPSLDHLNRWPIENLSEKRFEFDLPVYQMGNHLLHRKIYQQALLNPGIVMLHELSLNGLFHGTILQRPKVAQQREIIYERPDSGKNGQLGLNSPTDLTFTQRLVDCALGVVAHSHFVADRLGDCETKVLPFYGKSSDHVAPWPKRDGPHQPDIVFACGGLITPAKQIDLVLDALQQLVADGLNAQLLLVGEVVPEVPLASWIAERNLADQITVTGFVETIEQFESHLADADVVINLRQPTMGETSAVVLRSMALGRPAIVFDEGWYGELPDCCVKIPSGSLTDLVQAMKTSAADLDKMQQMGEACFAQIQAHHQPKKVAGELVGWIQETIDKIPLNLG